ncbi:esterase-like activity of phytase-domain-containing protein [Pterulicium gracile]|uniref:Esterase-like activity of phytase-domain-containing protein n=1 Tax=Pterulicium gracile TaxID=1884261 RepID=A0A5C3QQP1_9AGAR|nr:esterase-like activity of phytase-domain-containing protein [Pterula gracilis]
MFLLLSLSSILWLQITAAMVVRGIPHNGECHREARVAAVRTPTAVKFVDGKTYVNKGLVGFGSIPSSLRESTGDTLGGIGSAIAIRPGSWAKNANGSYAGVLTVSPDRGYNVETTIDYQSRSHDISFVLTPYEGADSLSYEDAQKTLRLTYEGTTMRRERGGRNTTGLDAKGVRSAGEYADPAMPIAAKTDDRLSLDIEGIAMNSDGSYWISDEYGPNVYLFSPSGDLLHTIQPPQAVLPRDAQGQLNFTSAVDPVSGRQENQGFEGLTIIRGSEGSTRLYAILQSATMQDGGADKSTARYTRLLGWDVSSVLEVPAGAHETKLVEEYIVPLPLSSKGKAQGVNELLVLGNDGVFLVLTRDGDGKGGDDAKSKHRQIDLISIKNATNIANTGFDSPDHPAAPKGVLDAAIVPAVYGSFVNMIEPDDLSRFGVHNGKPDDKTLLAAKWEGLAIAPARDNAFPDDWFLFAAADNDFLSTKGVSLGVPFNAGIDVDNQFLVWRVTIPGLRVD